MMGILLQVRMQAIESPRRMCKFLVNSFVFRTHVVVQNLGEVIYFVIESSVRIDGSVFWCVLRCGNILSAHSR